MVVFHWSCDRTVLSINRPGGGTTSGIGAAENSAFSDRYLNRASVRTRPLREVRLAQQSQAAPGIAGRIPSGSSFSADLRWGWHVRRIGRGCGLGFGRHSRESARSICEFAL
jgi:hypothetical protein